MNRWVKFIALTVMAVLVASCVTVGETRESRADPIAAARRNTELGIEYMKRGEYERAISKFERAVTQDPDYGGAHTMLGVLHERLGDDDKADMHYRKAVMVDSDNGVALNNYGVFLCKNGRMKESEKYFHRAATATGYPTPAAALTNAGFCARKRGDTKAAEDHFRHALRWNDRFGDALYQLADLSLETGDALSARAFLQRYISRNEASAPVLWLGVRIEESLGDSTAMTEYAAALRREFPNSQEAAELARLQN